MSAIRGKFACVTEGVTGIGYEFSRTLVRNGVKVCICYFTPHNAIFGVIVILGTFHY